MAIIINIDVLLAKRKMSATELSEKVGITLPNLFYIEKQQSESDSAINFGSDLQGFGMSARRHP